MSVDALRIPDTPLCIAASELLVGASESWLVNHCLRTFLWASALGKGEGHAFDDELLFVSAALHDLGLTPMGARLSPIPADCFAVEGAFAAEAFLRQGNRADELRRGRIAEAIALHLNVRVPVSSGIEAHLLHEGAGYDVIGARFEELGESVRSGVLLRYPRMDAKQQLVMLMKQQSHLRPRSRAAFLCAHGFITLIRKSPFVDNG